MLYITQGLPASGKTTWAEQKQTELRERGINCIIVERDMIRLEIPRNKPVGVFDKEHEKLVKAARNARIRNHLNASPENVVICSDTNLVGKTKLELFGLANETHHSFKVIDFTDVDVEECIKRDQRRGAAGKRAVGKDVILDMWYNHVVPDMRKLENNPSLPPCIIVDLDGTLCLYEGNNHYDRDYSTDYVNPAIKDIINNTPHTVFLVSGRKAEFGQITVNWLVKNEIHYDDLYMRHTGDTRNDAIVKEEILQEIVKDYYILYCIDDRSRVTRRMRSLGLYVLNVNQIEIDF